MEREMARAPSQTEREPYRSCLVQCRKEPTPKVTLTKTTIVKSSPFFITRHHLDDTEMKKALRYEQADHTQRIPRTFSYKGERVTCQNSKYVSQMENQPQKSSRPDYYALQDGTVQKEGGEEGQEVDAPYFKAGGGRRRSSHKESALQEYKLLTDRLAKNSQQGLREMEQARKKLEKESKKLRKLLKKKKQEQQREDPSEPAQLQQEVRALKIQTLELERVALDQQLKGNLHLHQTQAGETQTQTIKVRLGHLILHKGKYQPKQTQGEDTDSSFSSFQFSPQL